MSGNGEPTLTQAHVYISGRVQGVGFRWQTQRKAQELDLRGWVRNLWDGRVEAVFEGETQLVQEAVAWCRHGEPPARVRNIEVKYQPATNRFKSFRITW